MRNFDIMEVNVFLKLIQSHRKCIADEMHFMPHAGKLDAEFGCDYSAAAIGGIADHSDFHYVSVDKG